MELYDHGFGTHGHGEKALKTFLEIEKGGVTPNGSTFICVLSTCTHSGMGALLSACKTHSNLELGKIVAKRIIERDPEDIGSYVILSNIYTAQERWDGMEKVRKIMVVYGIRKEAGSSLVQFVNSDMWCFLENVSGWLKNNMGITNLFFCLSPT
ncbi:hypothetical protein FXO38_11326 [Capsicum annuum]|uniref:Pentatricopeptide repeat-containing protein n=1 Tax=Capsicum annuum TaxID=4072 RepID=A0A2G3A4D2_CAPAN|nr:hypothetical protein FXO38_11326 [Capsicum annuum]PHT89053.1 hypothetical protein T459_04166 [Capsicum annuum]